MGFHLYNLEIIYSECLKLPESERAAFIAQKAKGNKLLEDTLLSLIADKRIADIYFNELQQKIFESINPNTKKK